MLRMSPEPRPLLNRAFESMCRAPNNLSEVATVLESSLLSDCLAICILFTLSGSSCDIGAISLILQDGLEYV